MGSNSLNFDLGMVTEIHDVLSGLNAFKTELLQLHAVVSVCVCVCVLCACGGGWGCCVLCVCVCEWMGY